MKKQKFAHKAPDQGAAEPFDTAEEARSPKTRCRPAPRAPVPGGARTAGAFARAASGAVRRAAAAPAHGYRRAPVYRRSAGQRRTRRLFGSHRRRPPLPRRAAAPRPACSRRHTSPLPRTFREPERAAVGWQAGSAAGNAVAIALPSGFLCKRRAPWARGPLPQPPPPEGRGSIGAETPRQCRRIAAIPKSYPPPLGGGAGGGVSLGRLRRRPFWLCPTFAEESSSEGERHFLWRETVSQRNPPGRVRHRLSSRGEDQAHILAAEAEAVGQREPDLLRPRRVGHDVELDVRVRLAVVDRRRQHAFA